MIRLTRYYLAPTYLVALLLWPAVAGATHQGFEHYVGVWPEPVTARNRGAGNPICPAHPTQWTSAITYVGSPISPKNLARAVTLCLYCATEDVLAPECKKKWFNLVELIERNPDSGRVWSQPGQGGPCPPGTTPDSGLRITRNDPLTTRGTGSGCNFGPVIDP